MNMRVIKTAIAFLMAAALSACGGASTGATMEHKIGLVYFAPDESADNCMKGLFDGLKEQGIEERVNLEVRRSHAQAEIANIPLLIRNYDGSDVDVIVAMTTRCSVPRRPWPDPSRSCSRSCTTRWRPVPARAGRIICRTL